jgi:hypothetical protein
MLTVEEEYPHLAAGPSLHRFVPLPDKADVVMATEMLASVMIMRHMLAHNL